MPAPDPRPVSDLRTLSDARTIADLAPDGDPHPNPHAHRGRARSPEAVPGTLPPPWDMPIPSLDPDTITRMDDRRRLVKLLSGIAVMMVVLVGLPLLFTKVEWPWSDPPSKPPPQWVTLPTLRATTADGSGIKARVAIDVESSDTQSVIQNRVQQVSVMLEVTLASQGRGKVTSPQGLQQLSTDMRDRLNGYLAAEGVPPAKSVAIQDLVVSAP